MLVNIIPIGNSRGIRLPKAMLQQLKLGKQAELKLEDDRLVIQPLHRPREGWAEAFKALGAKTADNAELRGLRSLRNRFDDEEWAW
jgi:antitoxin MazE